MMAARAHSALQRYASQANQCQRKILQQLIARAEGTTFGDDHSFAQIKDGISYAQHVPIRDYEGHAPYIKQIIDGQSNVLWPGKPLYFGKTSGTTSGIKYIPITRDSMPNHLNGARNALLSYVHRSGNASFLDGKLIFLSGSPKLTEKGGIKMGRLSGIVNHHVPSYLKANQLPSYATNCIEDWETKLDRIVDETIKKDMRLISGIPPWMQMYFDRLMAKSGKPIGKMFPNFSLLVHGGVNFSPYKAKLMASIGRHVDTIETYPASEGFIAFQDKGDGEGLMLNVNDGIYYEFVPLKEFGKPNPVRLPLHSVSLDEQYAIILSTNAGLWSYSLGDTVKFISTNPYRILVTGRTKHFISAFGEHVIAEEVEASLREAIRRHGGSVVEFTVAPQINPKSGLPYHEWFIEFDQLPKNKAEFAAELDAQLQARNIYYRDLMEGNILKQAVVSPVRPGGFIEYMKAQGRLGGQNKLPRLSNGREIADQLQAFLKN